MHSLTYIADDLATKNGSVYGKHSEAVIEVLDYMRSGQALCSGFDRTSSLPQLRVINSLRDAERYRDPDHPGALILGDIGWTDIQVVDDDEVASHDWIASHEDEWRTLEAAGRDCWEPMEYRLRGVLPEEDRIDVGEFLLALAYQRAVSGCVDSLRERLYVLYRASGYPFGWEGAYPEGRVVVYDCRGSSP